MSMLRKIALLAVALPSLAIAQDASRTFQLTTVPDGAPTNELATILRTIADAKPHSEPATRQMTVSGSDEDLALSAWLVSQLDTKYLPVNPPRYHVSAGPDDSVRVYFVMHVRQQSDLNELVTLLRTNAGVQRIFTYTPSHAIILRGTESQVQLTDWLVQQLDLGIDSHPAPAQYKYPAADCADGLVQVSLLDVWLPGAGLNEVVSTIRAVADIHYVFTRTAPRQAIVFRGCRPQVEIAGWLIQSVTAPPDPRSQDGKSELVTQGVVEPVTRVYYLYLATPGQLETLASAIRSQAFVTRIFVSGQRRTLALRGAPDMLAAADRIIQQWDSAKLR